MSRFRQSLVAGTALVLALALWVLLGPATEPDPTGVPTLVQATQVQEVRIGASFALVRTGDRWTARPGGWTPSPRLTDRVVRDLAGLRPRAVLAERGADLSKYGLAEGAVRVEVVDASQGTAVLEIGHTSPSGASRYVRAPPRPQVFLVPSAQADLYTRPPDAWRESRFARFDPASAVEVDVRVDGRRLVLRRAGDAWFLESPARYRLDAESVDALLEMVSDAHALAWLDLDPAGLGIDAASDRVFVRLADGSTHTVRAGDRIDAGGVTARAAVHEESGAVVAVEADLLAPFGVDPVSWRVRDPVALYPWQVEAVSVRRGGATVRLARGPAGWVSSDGAALTGPLADRLVRAASEPMALGYHEAPVPQRPWAEVVLFGADHTRTLILGDARPEARRYVWLDGDPTAYEVDDRLGPLVTALLAQEAP